MAETIQQLRHPIIAYDWIPDRFYVISMEFLSLSLRRSSSRNVPMVMSEEKRLFLQAIKGLAAKHIGSEQTLQGALVAGREKEGELATTAPFTRQKIFGAAWMKVVRVPKN